MKIQDSHRYRFGLGKYRPRPPPLSNRMGYLNCLCCSVFSHDDQRQLSVSKQSTRWCSMPFELICLLSALSNLFLRLKKGIKHHMGIMDDFRRIAYQSQVSQLQDRHVSFFPEVKKPSVAILTTLDNETTRQLVLR